MTIPAALLLLVIMVLPGLMAGGIQSQQLEAQAGRNVAEAMLTSRFYAERSLDPSHSGHFDPLDFVPARHQAEYGAYELSGYAEDGAIYVYTEAAPALLEQLSQQTDNSLNVGIIRDGHVMELDAPTCERLQSGACELQVPADIPVGSVVAAAGSGNQR